MILSRTPFRVSFFGGGTDLRSYYSHGYGAVLSTTIQKYVYALVNERFDGKLRVTYSIMELVENAEELQHELVKEALKLIGINNGVEITTMADVPGRGTGIGSSSSTTIGVLNALWAYKGIGKSAESLAKEACRIEIDMLGKPIGKQDQYAAAYGGLNYIQFNRDETVRVYPIRMPEEAKKELEENLMLFYTGIARKSETILKEQNESTPNKLEFLDQMREQAGRMRRCLEHGSPDDLDEFGEELHRGWQLKKRLASGITLDVIDRYYEAAVREGAIGGKICGAGGGGFLLLYCHKERQNSVRKALEELKEVEFKFSQEGSKIIYKD